MSKCLISEYGVELLVEKKQRINEIYMLCHLIYEVCIILNRKLMKS